MNCSLCFPYQNKFHSSPTVTIIIIMPAKRETDSDDDDDISQASNQLNTDNSPKPIPVARMGDKLRTKRIVINISDTQYPIIEEVAEELGWIVQKSEGVGDWDLWWTDRQIECNTLFRMHLYQKINHFPGIYILARKNLLGLGLMGMRERFPQQYDFFPQTWIVPLQFSQFRHYYESVEKGKTRTYIVKPEALSQGRGIFLTRNIEDILNGKKYVIQRYIKNPLLIDRLKFDLRIYVLLGSCDPLRLYIYEEGLTRFATEEYQEPTDDNLGRSYVHLTNYSLNKSNPKYIYNTSDKEMDKGHKRTLTSTYERLRKMGHDVNKLKAEVENIIIKTMITGLPSISHQYQYCQPEDYEGNMCFHILGFDVMITDDLKPVIIEVNHTPSFETGSPLDYLVKKGLVKDTLKLMRIAQKYKRRLFERAKEIAKVRLETGKREIYKGEKRDNLVSQAQAERTEFEKEILGGYKVIYPTENADLQAKYKKLLAESTKLMKEDNETRKKIMIEEKKPKQEKGEQLKRAAVGKQGIPEMDTSIEYCYKTNIEQIEKQILQKTQAESQLQSKRNSFRTKVNRKPQMGSQQHFVKYNESIKKFNDIMQRFVYKGIDLTSSIDDDGAFLKIKHKIIQERDSHTSSHPTQQGKPPAIIENPQIKQSNRNGFFVKPKNYSIIEQKPQEKKKPHQTPQSNTPLSALLDYKHSSPNYKQINLDYRSSLCRVEDRVKHKK